MSNTVLDIKRDAKSSSTLAEHGQLVAHTLGDPEGLHFRFLPGGRLHSIRHGEEFLLNLVLGCPLSGSLQRLCVELNAGEKRRVVTVMGPGSQAEFAIDSNVAQWRVISDDVTIVTSLKLNGSANGWDLVVEVENKTEAPITWRAFHGLDVGLSNVGAVRINESYTSQYIDHRALNHADYGKVVASRQNLEVDGKHPVLLQACLNGCEEFASDGRDVFGSPIERLSLLPLRMREGAQGMPGIKQGEMSYVALLSAEINAKAGSKSTCQFAGVFVEDHQEPTSDETLHQLDQVSPVEAADLPTDALFSSSQRSLFDAPKVVHGVDVLDDDMQSLYPDEWSLEERSPEGTLWSFFTGKDSRHVVTRAKEILMGRPHATILRSGAGDFPAPEQLSSTCFAAGIFHSLLSAGHVSFNRMLSFPREACGLSAASGQRVWIADEEGENWSLLGVPSVFEMGITHARWIYVMPERTVEVVSYVDDMESSCGLDIKVTIGADAEFLITNGLIGGIGEYDAPAQLDIDADRAIARLTSAPDSMWRQHDPNAAFVLQVENPELVADLSGAETVGGSSSHAMCVVKTKPSRRVRITMKAESDVTGGFKGDSWKEMASSLKFKGQTADVQRLNNIVPWFVHNGMIHFTVPHGIEQYNGGAWGSRDVTQGSVEMLLSYGRYDSCRRVLIDVYRHQYAEGHHWPQWFMLEPFGQIMQSHSHGDIPMWPIKALCDYLEATSDFAVFDEIVPWTNPDGSQSDEVSSLKDHVQKNLTWLREHCVPGTALISYGDGDWNDSLQPAKAELKKNLVSSWSVALCYQTVSRLAEVSSQSGVRFDGLDGFADEIRSDFHERLIIDDTVCGFYLFDESGQGRPLLHPQDDQTGISYRLLPMTRSMIGGLFTADEAEHHNQLIDDHLLAADGARLMDRPPQYKGGKNDMLQRAETSPCFSRESGIFYTHAHLRYIEAMARLGKADEMWTAIGKVNPAGIADSVPNALPRQANAYFSSSDAVVATRYEADENYAAIKSGDIPVEGGWRIYSSGPGIFLQVIMSYMIGIRRRYDKVEIDPVLPRSLDGLDVEMPWGNTSLSITFSVKENESSPKSVKINNINLDSSGRTENPYRDGGWVVDAAAFDALLGAGGNRLEIQL